MSVSRIEQVGQVAQPRLGQIPRGVQDRFLGDAARRRQAEARLRNCFAGWGYQEVIPPTIEYDENLSVGASESVRQAMYRLFDREGRTLALRSDFTPQIARMAATKLFDQPMPLRCFYLGSVFRYDEPQAGRKREFTQAGIELIGASTPAADAEAVALAIGALDALGLERFQVNLGQMAFFRAIAQKLGPETTAAVRQAIDHRSQANLDAALKRAGVGGALCRLLQRLPDLVGGLDVLAEARALAGDLSEPHSALAALARLEEVACLLGAQGVHERVILDLGEVRGMGYYTGITFRAVAPGLGWPLVSGGRYDDLISRFGRSLAAIGWGLGIERALLAQARQGAPSPDVAPNLLVQGCDDPGSLALVARLREMGLRVVIDLLGLDGAGLRAWAQEQGIARLLQPAGDGWLLIAASGESRLSTGRLLAQARTWFDQDGSESPIVRGAPVTENEEDEL